MKTLFRNIFKFLCRLHPTENGKYKILMKLYYPFLAPKDNLFVKTKLKYGIMMNLNIKEYVQAFLYNYGVYETPTIKFFRKQVQSGMNIVDIGANVGYHSLILSTLTGSKGRVFSFEPENYNLKLFKENININNIQNIEIIQKAVSNSNGVIKLYLSNSDNLGVHSTVYSNETLTEKFEEIECVTLDTFAKERDITVNFVKIDVEGAETDVLAGMDFVLKNHKPILVLELVEKLQKLKNTTTSEVKKMLHEKYNYLPYELSENGDISIVEFEKTHVSENIVFICKE